MKTFFVKTILFILVFAAIVQANVSLVNFSFENPAQGYAGGYTEGTSPPTGWALTQGSFWGGVLYPYGWNATESNQALWLQTNNVADGYQSQTIRQISTTAAVTGRTYYLSFAGTYQYGWTAPNQLVARILIDGAVKTSVTISGDPAGAGWFFYKTPEYVATATDNGKIIGVEFYFENLDNPNGHAKTFLDNIIIAEAVKPVLSNTGFETPAQQNPGDYTQGTTPPTSWSLTQGNFWGGVLYPYEWDATEGKQVLWVQTNNVADGYQSQTIRQTSTSTAVEGNNYILTFSLTNRWSWGTPNVVARLLIDGAVKASKTIYNAPAGLGWFWYNTPPYTATASDAGKSIAIEYYFENLGDPVYHAQSYIDSIIVGEIAKPALVNASFDTPAQSPGGYTEGTTPPTGWTLTQGSFWGGVVYPYEWGVWPEPAQTLWLQTNNIADGYQSQTISQTSSIKAVPGKTYSLSFVTTGETGMGTPNIIARLLVDGQVKTSKTILDAPAGAGWVAHSTPAYTATTADAGKLLGAQFYFENLGDPVGNAKTYLDSVTISESHEPLIDIAVRPTKICQIVGDWDLERNQATLNPTGSLYGWPRIDLGCPFAHNGATYLVFGDVGDVGVDPIAYSTDTNLEDGLSLTFLENQDGSGRPVSIPGISLWGYEVPMEGVSANGNMYIYATTDHTEQVAMGRSVVAASYNHGYNFTYLYDLSVDDFINVSIVKVNSDNWDGLPISQGEGLVMFGTGSYRESNVKLAFQPAAEIEDKKSIRYFMGLDAAGRPIWGGNEADAIPLFNQPYIGEISVSYNKFIKRWIMLYNDFDLYRGINIRTAKNPWGPWSWPQTLFHPWTDGGYCHFMHITWDYMNCDDNYDVISGPYVSGGEYGPYQFEDHATGDADSTTIYFTMSTWNPYTSILMKTTLELPKESTILLQDGFETNFDKWTDGGACDWDRATDQKYSGSYSARAGSADNDLISDNLNTAGKSTIKIGFWYMDDDIDADDDIYLQLYNGSTYANKFELDTATEDKWYYYETTINNSGGDAQYFRSNFRIKFEGTSIDSGEYLWIDDVTVSVE